MSTLESVVAPTFFMSASYSIVSPADTPLIKSLSTNVSLTRFKDISDFVVRATVATAIPFSGFPDGGVPSTLSSWFKLGAKIRGKYLNIIPGIKKEIYSTTPLPYVRSKHVAVRSKVWSEPILASCG